MHRPASSSALSTTDLTTLAPAERVDYLRILWNADIPPLKFVAIARRLGYFVMCQWDSEHGMPMLSTLH
ncbi:hypothetical protein [Paraburkholderia sp. SIMBA_030]|uniref:hypothetical protein n=1 Tax=Paraburkholderia sp. SIMBA_030 TaxID=3085773 RepID=UPI003978A64E